MYADDSFFTLSIAGRAGLLVLSGLLALVTVWSARRLMRHKRLPLRLGVAVMLFTAFVWLSPQIYYAYYQMIFSGLPMQWVIGWPPLHEVLRKVSFTGPDNLSAHSQGVLFWLLVVLALRGSKPRDPHP